MDPPLRFFLEFRSALCIPLLLLTACTPSQVIPTTTIEPSFAITESQPPTPRPADTLVPTVQPTDTRSPTLPAVPTLNPEIYPTPLPFLNPVNGVTGHGCPDLAGVEKNAKPSMDEILPILQAVRSGNIEAYKQASDPSFWPREGETLVQFENPIEPGDVTLQPAAQAPYAGLLRTACGQDTLDRSWWAQAGTGALATHYFLIELQSQWLVWISYP